MPITERELLLEQLTVHLSTILAFAGTVLAAIRVNTTEPATAQHVDQVQADVLWLAALVNEVHALTKPVARLQYGEAARAAAGLASSLAWLTNVPSGQRGGAAPPHLDLSGIHGTLERWSGRLEPSLVAVIQALERVSVTCIALARF